MTTEDVGSYYDEMQRFYSTFWHADGIHYGVWDDQTSTHDAAIHRANAIVADALTLKPGSRVLDAGCGIGGTSFYLAQNCDYELTGLTLSRTQLAVAQQRARSFSGPSPTFLFGDYTRTGVCDGYFDGMFGIESICYEACSRQFALEAARILRPQGRLVVLDGFAAPHNRGSASSDLRAFCDGFALRELATVDDFVDSLQSVGFVDAQVRDLSMHVLPSASRIEWLARLGTMLALLAPLAPQARTWRAHCRAGRVQRRLLEGGEMQYLLVTATRR